MRTRRQTTNFDKYVLSINPSSVFDNVYKNNISTASIVSPRKWSRGNSIFSLTLSDELVPDPLAPLQPLQVAIHFQVGSRKKHALPAPASLAQLHLHLGG
jgi:hypothetical protein